MSIYKKDLALIGIGYWGKNLARNFHQLGALHSVCDLRMDHVKQYKTLYSDVHFTRSIDEILGNPDITKVVIAVPTALHYSLATQALSMGKDVFVEKAMSLTAEEAFEMASLAKKMKRILMIGHILHYHPGIERIKQMIHGGDLGKPLHLHFTRLNFGSRGPEKSALWAFAPHDISILLSFCKDYELETIRCAEDRFYSDEHTDQSLISLGFNEDVRANIHVNWIHPVPERRLTIVGTKGTLIFDDLKDWGEKLTFWENTIQPEGHYLKFNHKAGDKIILEPKEPLHEECKHFLKCCKTRKTPITDGFEGYKVMRVLDLANQSVLRNETQRFDMRELNLI